MTVCHNPETWNDLTKISLPALTWIYKFAKYAVQHNIGPRTNQDIVNLYETISKHQLGRENLNDMDQLEVQLQQGLVIFTKQECEYCQKIKEILNKHNVKYVTVDMTNPEERERIYNVIDHYLPIKYRKFPMIFLDAKFLGGFNWFERVYYKPFLGEHVRREDLMQYIRLNYIPYTE